VPRVRIRGVCFRPNLKDRIKDRIESLVERYRRRGTFGLGRKYYIKIKVQRPKIRSKLNGLFQFHLKQNQHATQLFLNIMILKEVKDQVSCYLSSSSVNNHRLNLLLP
jgi:hypothetical protein